MCQEGALAYALIPTKSGPDLDRSVVSAILGTNATRLAHSPPFFFF